jgi:hypothetical protein
MPTVPRYGGQVSPTSNPGNAFAAPVVQNHTGEQLQQAGQALQQAGQAAATIQMDIQNRVNADRVMDATTQLTKARTDLQIEAVSLQGRAALERPEQKTLPDEYTEKLDKVSKELSATLGNDAQRATFNQHAAQTGQQLYGVLGTHLIQQSKQFRVDGQNAKIEEAQRQGGLLWGDSDARAQAANDIRVTVADIVKDNGLNAEKDKAMIDSLTAKAMSPFHSSVVKGMIDTHRTDEARQYYDEHKSELTTPVRVQLHDVIQAGDFEKRTQEGAELMLKEAGGDISVALTKARDKYAGKDEDGIVHRLNALDTEKAATEQRDANRVAKTAWTSVMETGRIAPSLRGELRTKAPEEEKQIRDWLDAKGRRAKADAEGKTTYGFDTYYGLRKMAMDEPATFAQLDLRKSAPLLGDAQLNSLVNIQSGISKSDAKAMESQRVIKSTLGMIKTEVAAIGLDLTPKEGTDAARKTNEFMGALTQSLDDATAHKGAPLTADESRRIGMSMVREGIEQNSGIFFNNKKRGYQIVSDPDTKPGANFVVKRFADIPVAIRTELAAAQLKRANRGRADLTSADMDAIERAYTNGVNQGRFK